jgi:hypothetical protein
MTTAIGSYATLAAVKARLSGTFDSADDTLIGTLCDQANAYIEGPQGCGRVVAPRPVGSGTSSANEIQSVTLAGAGLAGGTWSLTFNGSTTTAIAWNASAATLQGILEALPTIGTGNVTVTGNAGGPYAVEFKGALAGLAQSLMTASAALLTVQPCTVTVALVSTPQDALYYFDGDGTRVLWVDVRAVTELAVASSTGASYTVLPATDYYLRPLPQDRDGPAWPATRIELSDMPTGGFRYFPAGYATVRMTAVTGWPAIPDDITDVALTMVVRAWHARQSGQTDIVGSDETGAPMVSRYLSSRDRETLRKYRVTPSVR